MRLVTTNTVRPSSAGHCASSDARLPSDEGRRGVLATSPAGCYPIKVRYTQFLRDASDERDWLATWTDADLAPDGALS
jgi:hypothetical protein